MKKNYRETMASFKLSDAYKDEFIRKLRTAGRGEDPKAVKKPFPILPALKVAACAAIICLGAVGYVFIVRLIGPQGELGDKGGVLSEDSGMSEPIEETTGNVIVNTTPETLSDEVIKAKDVLKNVFGVDFPAAFMYKSDYFTLVYDGADGFTLTDTGKKASKVKLSECIGGGSASMPDYNARTEYDKNGEEVRYGEMPPTTSNGAFDDDICYSDYKDDYNYIVVHTVDKKVNGPVIISKGSKNPDGKYTTMVYYLYMYNDGRLYIGNAKQTVYDKDMREISELTFNNFDFSYDDFGNILVTVHLYYNYAEWKYTYGTDGRIKSGVIRRVYYRSSYSEDLTPSGDEIIKVCETEYDIEGRIVTAVNSNERTSGKTFIDKEITTYEGNTKTIVTEHDGVVSNTKKYVFNENGDLIELFIEFPESSISTHVVIENNEKGDEIKKETYGNIRGDISILSVTSTWLYY